MMPAYFNLSDRFMYMLNSLFFIENFLGYFKLTWQLQNCQHIKISPSLCHGVFFPHVKS